MNIILASPLVLLRKALAVLLDDFKDCRVVLDVDSVFDSFEQVEKALADILVLDSLDPAHDLEQLPRVRKLFPEAKILLLTDGDDEEFQVRAVKCGARGCLSKRSEPTILERALRAVGQRGEVWVSHQTTARIIGKFMQTHTPQDHSPELEWQILAMVAKGAHNKEIAARLFISENTIKTHLYTVYKKLGVTSRLGAAMYYFQQAKPKGSVQPDSSNSGEGASMPDVVESSAGQDEPVSPEWD
jgi:DNA-binding NarL/FixJ family response regulator